MFLSPCANRTMLVFQCHLKGQLSDIFQPWPSCAEILLDFESFDFMSCSWCYRYQTQNEFIFPKIRFIRFNMKYLENIIRFCFILSYKMDFLLDCVHKYLSGWSLTLNEDQTSSWWTDTGVSMQFNIAACERGQRSGNETDLHPALCCLLHLSSVNVWTHANSC